MQVEEKIRNIIKKAQAYKIQNLTDLQANIEGIVIFPNSVEEIENFTNELSNLGTLMIENSDSVVFRSEFDGSSIMITVSKNVIASDKIGEVVYSTEEFDLISGEIKEIEVNGVLSKQVDVTGLDVLITFIKGKGVTPEHEEQSVTEVNQAHDQPTDNTADDDWKIKFEQERNARVELMADFQNFRKRMEEEKALFGAISNMSLIQDLLEVFDDLNLALNDNELNLENAKQSMLSAQQKLQTASEKAGIVRVDVNIGDEFDKATMEAISAIDAGEDRKGKVVAVINSAMKYRDREGIIKPAKVVVGK